ncbi:SDR family NAD(P)-dependent oxidoreductase [Nocardioides sp. LML1-1-1.1]|uniref:SDR family NAD(P)-dependent oxidoreductase n=1 Tax=Nocardioides sp. LML1-1-1.1 TaxID=3135248 RepID=UPI003415AD07
MITGGAAGIGRATAQQAWERGADVVLIDRNDEVERVASEMGTSSRPVRWRVADVTDLVVLEAAVDSIAAECGRIDVVVANAGIGPRPTSVAFGDREHQRRLLDVNLHGVWHTAWASASHLVDSGGHLAIISSVTAFAPTPAWAGYGASKAAVESLARAMRIELAPSGVSVGVIHFGFVDTGLVRAFAADPLNEALEGVLPAVGLTKATPADAAAALVDSIERRRPRLIYPARFVPVYLMRGLIGPVVDAYLVHSPRSRSVLRSIVDNDRATSAP